MNTPDAPRFLVHLGDSGVVLPTIPDNSVDAVVSDPPAGIAFMQASWDKDKGGRDAWVAWMANIARECLRITKPGGHALVWALPRTSHWTAMAWENAGWEVREKITHLNSEGFPKSHSIGKAIDKMAGAERDVVGSKVYPGHTKPMNINESMGFGGCDPKKDTRPITVPVTEDAKKWEGWGTGLKPASEDWWLLRKPCDQPTVAQNVLTHGTGALNIDDTRVATNPNDPILESRIAAGRGFGVNARVYGKPGSGAPAYDASKGRHPANLVVSHHPGCVATGTRTVPGVTRNRFTDGMKPFGEGAGHPYTSETGEPETITTWECHPDCQAAALDRQSGYTASTTGGVAGWQDQYVGGELAHPVDRTGYDDAGGASRFFNTFMYEADDLPDHESFIYTPKPSQSERHEGLPDDGNIHPTVKSKALMLHLVTLITPPGGVVLDPFTGSGSTGVAAMYHSPTTRFIGVEQDPTYHGIASARISYHLVKSMGGVPNPFTGEAPAEAPAVTMTLDDLFGF